MFSEKNRRKRNIKLNTIYRNIKLIKLNEIVKHDILSLNFYLSNFRSFSCLDYKIYIVI